MEPLKTGVKPPLDDEQVEKTLDRILSSPAFRNSKQCQKFLRYVVNHSHAGEEDRLKERSIGIEVFGRDPGYDTAGDPIVRVRATEVRKRLAQYYQESAVEGDVRFEIPAGSYKAEFHPMAVRPAVMEGLPPRPHHRIWWLWLLVPALAVLLLAADYFVSRPSETADILDQFWAPVIRNPKPVLLYCGQPVVYFLSREVRDRYGKEPADRQSASQPVELPPDAVIRGRDVIPVTEQFVGIGNAHTAAQLTSLFAARHKPIEIRYANDLSFSDLRGSPSVLIGAFSNLWTLEMTGKLRFVFEQKKGARWIRDQSKNRTWQLDRLASDGKTPEDFAIVSRLFDSATGQLLISAAGITQYGTRSAGEFLTDSSRMREALAKAPPDWAKQNMQVLLHTTIYRGTPAPPRVLDVHFW